MRNTEKRRMRDVRPCQNWTYILLQTNFNRKKSPVRGFLTVKTIFSTKGPPFAFFTSFPFSEFYKGNPLEKNGLNREKTHFFVFFIFTVPHEVKNFFFIFPGCKIIFLNTWRKKLFEIVFYMTSKHFPETMVLTVRKPLTGFFVFDLNIFYGIPSTHKKPFWAD